MPIYTNINGNSKSISNLYDNINAAKKTNSAVYANINNSSKKIFPVEPTIYTWAKYAKGSHYMDLQYRYGSWKVSLYRGYSICKSISVISSENEDSNGHGRVYYGDNETNIVYYPGEEGSFVGCYLCAPYNTVDVSGTGAIIPADSAGSFGYYAYKISGCEINDDGKRYTLLSTEVRANYSYNYDDFIEYVTSTDKDAYPKNAIVGDYKYVLQN